MRFNLSAWAIRQPLPSLALFVLLMALGAAAWWRLPVQSLPAVAIPIIQVTVVLDGASAEDLETQVAMPLEAALTQLVGVKRVTSVLGTGQVQIIAEFRLEVPMDRAASLVRDGVSQVRPNLPGAAQEPVVERIDASGVTLMTWSVSGGGRDVAALSRFIDEVVRREILAVPGVASVRREGGVQREVRIELRTDALLLRGVSVESVDNAIRAALTEHPGGIQAGSDQERLIRIDWGGNGGLDAVAALRIALADGTSPRLDELATVSLGAAEPTSVARLDGVEVVGFSLERSKGASELQVAAEVQAVVARLGLAHPWASFLLIAENVEATRESYQGAVSSLIEGAILAVLVVGVFLRDWRATAVCAVAIPLSIVPTVAFMYVAGFSFNAVSLLGITLVSGLLVDDAIVEIENIVRYQRRGLSPYRASMLASGHIGLAVVATSLVIVAVFLPVSAMPGVVGRYFVEFGSTISVAVLMSLLVARLITPLLTAYLLRDPRPEPPGRSLLSRWFGRSLLVVLRRPGTTILGGVAVLVLGVFCLDRLPTGFLADEDRGVSMLQMRIPPGTPLAEADRRMATLADVIRRQEGIRSVFTRVAVPTSEALITLVPRRERLDSVREVQTRLLPLLAAIPDQQVRFLGSSGVRDVSLTLRSDDPVALEATRDHVLSQLRTLPQLTAVGSDDAWQPQWVVRPHPENAAALGCSAQALATALRLSTQGDQVPSLAQVTIAGARVPVRVLAGQALRRDPALLAAIPVPTNGSAVPLGAVAGITIGEGPISLTRIDRQRAIRIEADLHTGATLGTALEAVDGLMQAQPLPPGVRLLPEGDGELLEELFTGFAMAAMFGLFCVYLILVLLYHDLFQPLTVIVSLPLALVGAAAALWLTGNALNLAAMIGLLTLLGIVAKNAILVVDDAGQRQAVGQAPGIAVLRAALTRARPILMTTLAMIAGMVPIVIGVAPDAAFRQPMAWAVIGGLVSSTLLSLGFVPALYLVTARTGQRLRGWAVRLIRVPTPADLAEDSFIHPETP